MVVLAFVRRDDDRRVLVGSFDAFLDRAFRSCASVVASAQVVFAQLSMLISEEYSPNKESQQGGCF